MTFTLDEFIESFWLDFERCHTKDDYIALINKVELMIVEYMSTLDAQQMSLFLDESPLLAMINEINQVSPEAVQHVSEKNGIINAAAEMLSDYDQEDKRFLRRNFLNRNTNNIFYVDFNNNKKGD